MFLSGKFIWTGKNKYSRRIFSVNLSFLFYVCGLVIFCLLEVIHNSFLSIFWKLVTFATIIINIQLFPTELCDEHLVSAERTQFVSLKYFKIQTRQNLPIPTDLIQLHAAIWGYPCGPCTSDSLLQAPAHLRQPAATNLPVPRLGGSTDWSARCQQGVMAATPLATILQGEYPADSGHHTPV